MCNAVVNESVNANATASGNGNANGDAHANMCEATCTWSAVVIRVT